MDAGTEEAYRAELEQVLAFFGNKRVLNISDTARYTGKSFDWCKKTFGVSKGNEISATQFARAMVHL